MVLPALQLDHQPGLRPVHVDQEVLDGDVQLWEQQARLAHKVKESGLQIGFGFHRDGQVVVEQSK